MPAIIQALKESLPSLPKREFLAAKAILSNPLEASKGSIVDLAHKSGASTATFIRLAKRMGFLSYREFMRQVYLECQSSLNYSENILSMEGVVLKEPVDKTIERVISQSVVAIQNNHDALSPSAVSKALEWFQGASRITFYGIGGSAVACLDASYKFRRLGMDASCYSDVHDQVLSSTLLKSNDVACFISYSGESRDLLKTLKIAKQVGAHILCITSNPRSLIAESSDLVLLHSVVSEGVRTNATSSRLVQLNVVDVLFAQLASLRLKDLEKFHELTNTVFLGDKNLGRGR